RAPPRIPKLKRRTPSTASAVPPDQPEATARRRRFPHMSGPEGPAPGFLTWPRSSRDGAQPPRAHLTRGFFSPVVCTGGTRLAWGLTPKRRGHGLDTVGHGGPYREP